MKRLSLLFVGFAFVFVSTWSAVPVSAASNSLGVNPRRDYTVKPGETTNDKLFVSNLSEDDALNVRVDVIDFKPANETGEPALQLDAKEPTRWSLDPYLDIPETTTIAAGKSAEIPFSITIPKNVGAGTYYSAIRYSAVGNPDSTNVSLSGSSVTLMFVRVPGEAKSFLQVEDFGMFTPNSGNKTGSYANFYSATAPKYISYKLNNEGNIAEQPEGSIMIKNMFGKQVKLFEDANPGNNIVLIDQTRRIDLCLNEERKEGQDDDGRKTEVINCNDFGFSPGKYTAQLSLTYGNEGGSTQEVKAISTFWYLPVWFIAAVIAGLALIAFLIWRVVTKFKNRGSHKFRGR